MKSKYELYEKCFLSALAGGYANRSVSGNVSFMIEHAHHFAEEMVKWLDFYKIVIETEEKNKNNKELQAIPKVFTGENK